MKRLIFFLVSKTNIQDSNETYTKIFKQIRFLTTTKTTSKNDLDLDLNLVD